jgi:ubiquinone/menaquinone biosynthesis C-methylase UbiE
MLDIAAAYDQWAEVYDIDPNRTRELAAAVLRQAELNLAGGDVLEIGCGTGVNTLWLAERAASVLALDFSTEMLRHAQARVRSSRVRFVQHDVRFTWPLADASVDLVLFALVLEHIEDLELIFTESARVLRSGGEIFLGELHPMRQLQGHQAQFTHPRTGDRVRVSAFLHDTAEYVNVGVRAGFSLVQIGEWRDLDASRSALPRLLSLHFRRSPGS